MIEKAAKAKQRAQRKDPTQEAIVRGKDEINTRTTKLIELLKELKRGWNGGPAPSIGISEKYNLTQPIPDEVVSTGDAALQELSSIIQGLHQIDSQQDTYSATRNQRMTERMQQMQQMQQQAAVDDELRKEASNKLTRLWSYIVAPFGSEKGKYQRIQLLRSLARIDSNLKDVEDKVLSGDLDILKAINVSKQLYVDAKGSFFEEFRQNLNDMLESTLKAANDLQIEITKEEKKKLERDRIKSEEEQGPLETGTPGVKDDTPEKEEVPKKTDEELQSRIDVIVEDLKDDLNKIKEETQNNKKDLTDVPPQMPKDPPVQTVDDALRGVETKPEETPEPSEPPEPDPKEKELALRQFIMTKATGIYKDIAEIVSKHRASPPPDPWASRIESQWSAIDSAARKIQPNTSRRQLSIDYLSFIKAVGDLKATVSTLENEIAASQFKPDFQFGVTLDDAQLDNQARDFLKSYQEDLMKVAGTDPQLIAQGGTTSRWVKRMLTHLSFKRDKNIRLMVAKHIRDARKGLQAMLNNLENRHINFRLLINQSDAFYESFIQVYDKLADLAESYNSRMRIEKAERKSKKERMNYDLIPTTDINAIKTIRNTLVTDRKNIQSLDKGETDISKLQADLEKMRVSNE